MNTLQIVNAVVVIIGVPAIVGTLIFVGRKLQTLDAIEITLGKVKANLKVVCDYLIGKDGFNHTELQAYSPLKLTGIGMKLIEETGLDAAFRDNTADFFSFIESEHPSQKHDVELAAIKSIYALQDKDYMGMLKTFFYNHPQRTIANSAPTLGVYIRDKYLSEHPEIRE